VVRSRSRRGGPNRRLGASLCSLHVLRRARNAKAHVAEMGLLQPTRRVQGPQFLIEYDATQDRGNHIHSVWRDFNGDFGRDLLRQSS